MIKKITLSFLLIISIVDVNAQDWNTDFEVAKKIAKEKNQHIILVFQGSDWCAPCIKLDREIWSSPKFIAYSKEHLVLLKVDFPRKSKNKLTVKQQQLNNSLMEKYDKQGYFPFVVVLDENAKVLGNTGYKKINPSDYIKLLTSFNSNF